MSNLFKSLKSPIQAQIKSEKSAFGRSSITGFDRIPYFGLEDMTSDATLKVIRNLCSLSPSFQAALKDKADSIFSNGVTVIENPVSGLASFEITPLELSKQIEFLKYLKTIGFDCNRMLSIFRSLLVDFEQIGNCYLEITYVSDNEIGKNGKFFFKYIPFESIGYKQENKKNASSLKTFLVCPLFGVRYETVKSDDVEETGATQMHGIVNFTGGEKVRRTILHIRNEFGTFYGEAKNIISVLEWLSTEYNVADKVAKISVTDTVTKDVFIFKKPQNMVFENKEQEKLYKTSRRKAFDDITTNQGDEPKTLAVLEVQEPNEFKHVSIAVHRNSSEDKAVLDLCREKIYAALTMSPRLNGGVTQQANLGGNANANEAEIMQKTINSSAYLFSIIIDRIFEIMYEVVEEQSLIENSLRLVTSYDVIERKKQMTLNDSAVIDPVGGN